MTLPSKDLRVPHSGLPVSVEFDDAVQQLAFVLTIRAGRVFEIEHLWESGTMTDLIEWATKGRPKAHWSRGPYITSATHALVSLLGVQPYMGNVGLIVGPVAIAFYWRTKSPPITASRDLATTRLGRQPLARLALAPDARSRRVRTLPPLIR